MGINLKTFKTSSNVQDLMDYLHDQLQTIEQSLNNGQDEIQLNVRHVPPPKPRVGTIAYADGVDWNPGSGEGVYAFQTGGWVKLSN